jgi:hypothetical protein
MRTPSLVLLGLVAVLGCGARAGTRPARDPAPSAGTVQERRLMVREATLGEGAIVARLEIPPDPPGPKPAILANLNEADTMKADGVVIVTYKINWFLLKGGPPLPPPAEKNTAGTWVLASPSAARLGEHYLRTIAATATIVVPKVLDYLETVPEVDMSRVAITGASTNGFIALQAVAADQRLHAASVIAACGDYERFLRYSSMGMDGRPLALDPEYTRWIASQELINHPRRVVHAALPMVNRVKDPLIPIGCADETARVLRRAYAAAGRSDRFRYVRIEDREGHGFGPQENTEHLAWMRTWMLRPQ